MKRPLLAAATLLSTALLFAGADAEAQTKTLRFVPHADLKILDPSFTTAYITRNFGYMVYDTLFAQDAKGTPKPQMVDKYTASKDGKQWSFTLRPGLKFHDGSAVDSKVAAASRGRFIGELLRGSAWRGGPLASRAPIVRCAVPAAGRGLPLPCRRAALSAAATSGGGSSCTAGCRGRASPHRARRRR
jgi:hypothetical protein